MPGEDFGFSKFANNHFYRRQNARLVDMVDMGSGQRIVDLACGTGLVTGLITERLKGARDSVVIGIDQSAAALKQAMDDLKDVRAAAVQFIQAQVENVSEAVKDSVDTVVFCNAIHYIPDKSALLADIFETLKPGGTLAFNTSFFDGAHLPETSLFYRKWMLKASRILRREHGLSPIRSEKVEARKQLSPEDYRVLLEENGFLVAKQEIDIVHVPLDGWVDISAFTDFIGGVMPGVPLEKASSSLRMAVAETFEEMRVEYIPRNWLDVVAVRA